MRRRGSARASPADRVAGDGLRARLTRGPLRARVRVVRIANPRLRGARALRRVDARRADREAALRVLGHAAHRARRSAGRDAVPALAHAMGTPPPLWHDGDDSHTGPPLGAPPLPLPPPPFVAPCDGRQQTLLDGCTTCPRTGICFAAPESRPASIVAPPPASCVVGPPASLLGGGADASCVEPLPASACGVDGPFVDASSVALVSAKSPAVSAEPPHARGALATKTSSTDKERRRMRSTGF